MRAILIVQEGTAQEIADLAQALQGQQPSFSSDEVTEHIRKSLMESMELKKDYQLQPLLSYARTHAAQ